jgi:tRNA-splicing ligase RtcB
MVHYCNPLISFGVGRSKEERVEHALFDDGDAWRESDMAAYRQKAVAHGAGRLFGRKEAKRRFARAEMDAWLQSRGVTLIGADLDESPMAYRRLSEVLAEHARSIKVLHPLRPFAVAMAGENEFDPFKD